MITVVDQSRVTADLGSRFSAANRAANKFTVIHEELSSRLTTGNVEGHAVNIASSITEEERHGIGNLAELAGAAQWRSTGLGIALPKLLNGNAAGVGQRCFIGQRPQTGGLQNTRGNAHHADALLAQLLGPGTGQGVHRVFAGSIHALTLAAFQTGLGGHIYDHTRTLLHHFASSGLGAEVHALQVDVHHLVPCGLVQLVLLAFI